MHKIHSRLIDLSIRFPKTVMAATLVLVVALGSQIPRIHIDTDPENMLPPDQASRVFHNAVKADFTLYDMIVVGVVNETDPDGVFNPHTLTRIHDLTREIEQIDGVIRQDLLSLASIDNISQGGPGVVRFEWMMRDAPEGRPEALAVRDAANRLPTVYGTIVSEDGRAAAIYVPIESKDQSHRIATQIEDYITGFAGSGEDERYFITGLPVAEDTFGVEMFKQMGIAAPLAGLIIFLLMWVFFRSLALILSPMILAIVTVVSTMGLLIGMGYTVHIMSSMIPIFLMPIAVVDSVHILSEFADAYPKIKNKEKTIRFVMEDLQKPMHYTSLTSAVGFASLAFAPIPPVRVFGIFVAIGIALAFYLTITFIPAYVVRLSDSRIARLRRPEAHTKHFVSRFLRALGPRTLSRAKPIVAITLLIVAVSAIGISLIEINDNPVRWFRPSHRIRVADRALNHHFGGTYNAYLVLEKSGGADVLDTSMANITQFLEKKKSDEGIDLTGAWNSLQTNLVTDTSTGDRLDALIDAVFTRIDEAKTDGEAGLWEDVLTRLETAQTEAKYFQNPDALRYIEDLQAALHESPIVGKSMSLADIVKTVHRELREGHSDYYTIPGSAGAVAQTLLSYQSSHRPHDLWHFVTPDYGSAQIWLQLKSGDNQDMLRVVDFVKEYTAGHPLPAGVTVDWAGLTYLNVVWQEEMVSGMRNALIGSFIIVFIMMVVLFRSFGFGLLAMLPLSVTIAFIYGLVGLTGKDYDMPIAVLSSLTLGLSVDFAIHFLQRTRDTHHEMGVWTDTIRKMFDEPARAIARNAIVIAVGFLPLLASPLVPYNTVGLFLALIMTVSCIVTLILLPAVMNVFKGRLFRQPEETAKQGKTVDKKGKAMKHILMRLRKGSAVTGLVVLTLATGLGLWSKTAQAEDLDDVQAIVERANLSAYYAGIDGRAQVRMTITDAQGRERVRQFTILRKDIEDGSDQNYAVLFSRPADVRNTVFLVNKHVGKDDDRWLYLPDLDLVKRIAAGDKRTSFVGSHFFYEDVSGRGIDEDDHELAETTDEYYVVHNTPKDAGSVEFSEWTAWIDKTTFLPIKMEYADESGEVYRRIEVLEVEEFQGHPTVTMMKVSDLRGGGQTLSEFRGVEYDLEIPDQVFTERTLRSPSRQWFRTSR